MTKQFVIDLLIGTAIGTVLASLIAYFFIQIG
jgi:hypothetical protein